MLLSELSQSLSTELAQVALSQSSGGSSSQSVALIQCDHKASVKKFKVQTLSAVVCGDLDANSLTWPLGLISISC